MYTQIGLWLNNFEVTGFLGQRFVSSFTFQDLYLFFYLVVFHGFYVYLTCSRMCVLCVRTLRTVRTVRTHNTHSMRIVRTEVRTQTVYIVRTHVRSHNKHAYAKYVLAYACVRRLRITVRKHKHVRMRA